MNDAENDIRAIENRLQRLADGGMEEILEKALDEEEDFILDLNRAQLEDGMRADGTQLPPYSPYTVQIKAAKGQQTQPMNLRDTGAWQSRFQMRKYDKFFEIVSTDYKDVRLVERFGEQIEGLTQENIGVALDKMLPHMQEEFKRRLKV